MNILSIDPGHKRIAYAGWINGKIADVGIVHRPSEDLESFVSLFQLLVRPYDLVLIEAQYIKRVGKRKLQTAIAAATMKVMRAAAHCEALAVSTRCKVEWVHPKTWQTILGMGNSLSTQVKKASRKAAEEWAGSVPNQDVADAVMILKWYLTTNNIIKE